MKKLIALASVLTLVAGSSTVFGQCFTTNSYGYQVQVSCGSGWGGSSNLQRDYCPDGDNTLSYYDGMCDEGVASSSTSGGTTTSGSTTGSTTGTTTITTIGSTTGSTTGVVTNPTVTPTVDAQDDMEVKNLLDSLTNNSGGNTPPPSFALPTEIPKTGASL